MHHAEPGPSSASLLARAARESAIIAGQLLGVILLLFIILESGVVADPAVRALGERPSLQRLGELRVEMGYFRQFEGQSARLELLDGAATVGLAGQGNELLLESVQGEVLARFETRGKTIAELASELEACQALAPVRLRLTIEGGDQPAKGWVSALKGTRLLVDSRRAGTIPWADARPHWQRFLTQTGELLRLEFGRSLHGQAVGPELRRRATRSLAVSLPGLLLSSLLALALASRVSRHPGGRLDRSFGHIAALVIAVSTVSWVLLMRGWFAGQLQWFPVAAWDPPSLLSLVLPISIWVWIATWPDFQVYRKLLLEVARQPHVVAAQARGLSAQTVRRQHTLRNASATLVAHFVLALPFLIVGSLVLEQTFVIPGLGEYVVAAARSGDAAVLRAVTLCVALAYILSQRLGDWAAAQLDPRWRLQSV